MSVRSKFVASNFKFICLFFMTVEWKGIQYVFEVVVYMTRGWWVLRNLNYRCRRLQSMPFRHFSPNCFSINSYKIAINYFSQYFHNIQPNTCKMSTKWITLLFQEIKNENLKKTKDTINLSASSLSQADMISSVIRIQKSARIPPSIRGLPSQFIVSVLHSTCSLC